MNAVGIPDAPSAVRTAQPPAFRASELTVSSHDQTAVGTSLSSSLDEHGAVSQADTNLPLPTWDRNRLELRLGTIVLRRFKISSPHEEMILAVLEEMNWPQRIEDPNSSHDNPLQLERTIASLNRRQRPLLVDFRLDATGQGIVWEFSRAAQTSGSD